MNIDIRKYAMVTGAYWGFTLTDGALRMLVLLHFHSIGYSPFEIALLFLFYVRINIRIHNITVAIDRMGAHSKVTC